MRLSALLILAVPVLTGDKLRRELEEYQRSYFTAREILLLESAAKQPQGE